MLQYFLPGEGDATKAIVSETVTLLKRRRRVLVAFQATSSVKTACAEYAVLNSWGHTEAIFGEGALERVFHEFQCKCSARAIIIAAACLEKLTLPCEGWEMLVETRPLELSKTNYTSPGLYVTKRFRPYRSPYQRLYTVIR